MLAQLPSCALDASSSAAHWQACAGLHSSVTGRHLQGALLAQHPQRAGPGQIQDYLVLDEDRQLILVLATALQCRGMMRVHGRLEQIKLAGKAGTKLSYQGWQMQPQQIECLD